MTEGRATWPDLYLHYAETSYRTSFMKYFSGLLRFWDLLCHYFYFLFEHVKKNRTCWWERQTICISQPPTENKDFKIRCPFCSLHVLLVVNVFPTMSPETCVWNNGQNNQNVGDVGPLPHSNSENWNWIAEGSICVFAWNKPCAFCVKNGERMIQKMSATFLTHEISCKSLPWNVIILFGHVECGKRRCETRSCTIFWYRNLRPLPGPAASSTNCCTSSHIFKTNIRTIVGNLFTLMRGTCAKPRDMESANPPNQSHSTRAQWSFSPAPSSKLCLCQAIRVLRNDEWKWKDHCMASLWKRGKHEQASGVHAFNARRSLFHMNAVKMVLVTPIRFAFAPLVLHMVLAIDSVSPG